MSPEWIEQQNAETRLATSEADARTRLAVDAAARAANQGPAVFHRFIKALTLNAEALPMLEGGELFGATAPVGREGFETSCQVNVEWRRVSIVGPRSEIVVFHYERGSTGIRVYQNSERKNPLPLQVSHDGEVGIFYNGAVRSPEQVAEFIIRRLVQIVKIER